MKHGARFNVMRLALPIGREVGERIISVASRHYTLGEALGHARYLQQRYARCACWIVTPGQRGARVRRQPPTPGPRAWFKDA